MEQLSKNQSLLLRELQKHSHTMNSLEKFSSLQNISQSGFYKSLADLRERNIIFKDRKSISLHPHYLEKLSLDVLMAKETLKNVQSMQNLVLNKTAIVKKFSAFDDLIKAWDFYFSYLLQHYHPTEPYYVYSEHDWLSLLSPEPERLNSVITDKNKRLRIESIGSKTDLGSEIKSLYSSYEYIKHDFVSEKVTPKPTEYINIFGDIILRVSIRKDVFIYIDKIFKNERKISGINIESHLSDIEKIINNQTFAKMSIKSQPRKASILSKKIAKDFYIPRKDS